MLVALGLFGTAMVRPHFAAIWAGAILVALVSRVVLDAFGKRDADEGRRLQVSTLVLVVVAAIGFGVVATAAINFLPSDAGDDNAVASSQLSTIFENVVDRTSIGGSTISTVDTDNPAVWPYAAFRTITRPLLYEANKLRLCCQRSRQQRSWWRAFSRGGGSSTHPS